MSPCTVIRKVQLGPERRGRRRRQATPRGPQAPPQAHGRDAEAVREYEDTFTTALMQSGLPKMMSRVLTCLYTTEAGSLTASELVQHLQVSPASISKAITFLESQDLIRRERDERRRERYIVDDDVWYQAMIASARSTAQLVETVREGVGILGPGTPAAARLENIARFVDFVGENITRAAEQAREVLYTKAEASSPSSSPTRGPLRTPPAGTRGEGLTFRTEVLGHTATGVCRFVGWTPVGIRCRVAEL